jgi:hypothetical protein
MSRAESPTSPFGRGSRAGRPDHPTRRISLPRTVPSSIQPHREQFRPCPHQEINNVLCKSRWGCAGSSHVVLTAFRPTEREDEFLANSSYAQGAGKQEPAERRCSHWCAVETYRFHSPLMFEFPPKMPA